MISDFFYLNKPKATEDVRIAYYQNQLGKVQDMLSQKFFKPEPAYKEAYLNHTKVTYIATSGQDWIIYVTTDQVYINRNWWDREIDRFQQENRCKIPEIDYVCILMRMFHECGIMVRPCDGTLCITLYKHWTDEDEFEYDEEADNE